ESRRRAGGVGVANRVEEGDEVVHLVAGQAQILEHRVDCGGGGLDESAARIRQRGEDDPAVDLVLGPSEEPVALQPLHRAGDAGGMDLEPLADLSHGEASAATEDRKSTRLNSSHVKNSYAVFCLKKKKDK